MRRKPTRRRALLAVAALSIIAGSIVAGTGGESHEPSHAGPGFEYLAHVIMPAADKTSSNELARTFGGASGIDSLPGTLVRTERGATARFAVVSDNRKGARVYELEATFTRTGSEWAMSCELTREITLPHPFGDAESVVVLERSADRTWFAVSYEAPPGVAVFADPPRDEDMLKAGRRTPGHRLAYPDVVRKEHRGNRGFESLAMHTNKDGTRELWSVMEAALETDGPEATADAGSLVRAFVHRIESYDDLPLDRELTYTTDALPGSLVPLARVNSLAELFTMPDGSLATLERSATALGGYGGAIYAVSEQPDGTISKSRLTTIKDIAGKQLPWVGNYEGACTGPSMAELSGDPDMPGHLVLFIADDNFGADHQRGTQVLAVRVLQE